MEYMRLEGFLGKAISKLVNKAVTTKIGVNPGIELREMRVTTDEKEEYVKVQVTAFMPREAFENLIEEATK